MTRKTCFVLSLAAPDIISFNPFEPQLPLFSFAAWYFYWDKWDCYFPVIFIVQDKLSAHDTNICFIAVKLCIQLQLKGINFLSVWRLDNIVVKFTN